MYSTYDPGFNIEAMYRQQTPTWNTHIFTYVCACEHIHTLSHTHTHTQIHHFLVKSHLVLAAKWKGSRKLKMKNAPNPVAAAQIRLAQTHADAWQDLFTLALRLAMLYTYWRHLAPHWQRAAPSLLSETMPMPRCDGFIWSGVATPTWAPAYICVLTQTQAVP